MLLRPMCFFVLPRRFVNGLGLLSVMTVTAPPGMWRAHSQRIPMFSPQSPCGFLNLFQRFVDTFCYENFSFPRVDFRGSPGILWESDAHGQVGRRVICHRGRWRFGWFFIILPWRFLLDSSMVFDFGFLHYFWRGCSHFSILNEYLGNRCFLGWITYGERTFQNG